ncbi:hypothetical protein GCM10027346_19500 [Hymenobacter seoulensis]
MLSTDNLWGAATFSPGFLVILEVTYRIRVGAAASLAWVMKYLLVVLVWWLPLLGWAAAPPLEPLQIAEQFVAPGGWANMREYLCCEAAGQAKRQSLGQQIPATLQRNCQLLQQNQRTAVVSVELRDSVSRNDVYLHFRRDSTTSPTTWKLEAVRSLAMTQFGAPMLQLLSDMPPAEVARYNQKHPDADHQFMLGNIQLWIGPDADIIRHFERNKSSFERAVQLIKTRGYFSGKAASPEPDLSKDTELQAVLRPLYISRVTQRNLGCTSCLEFVIGGMVDNAVGLLYQPNIAAVPAMTPDHVIMLKPLGNGWYLYKTT